MAASFAVYVSSLLALWSVARMYDRPAISPAAGAPALGGWDLVSELR